jgi:hypothetical protein
MPYCSRCGVEVDTHIKECPLCHTPIQQLDKEEPLTSFKEKYPAPEVEKQKNLLTSRQKRMIALEIISVVLLIPFLVLVSVDLLYNVKLTWSLYPLSAIVLAWLLSAFPLIFGKRWIFITIGEVLSIVGFLAALDLFDGRLEWFNVLALPLISITIFVISIVSFLSVKAKHRGTNIAAFIILGIGVICVGFDLIISAYYQQAYLLSWSIIVFLPCLVLGLFLLYVHYRLYQFFDFKKIFRI